MTDYLGNAYPKIAARLRKYSFASLPTPISQHLVAAAGGKRTILVKHDDRTSSEYGGNKVRKLEYVLRKAVDRGAKRVATFGAVGSNHALATAIFARRIGLQCTCFLVHQKITPGIARTLNMHLELGTELVRFGGSVNHLDLFRRYLQHRECWVIPFGGTTWLGAIGFVNAGLELAAQIAAGEAERPHRIYIANGTMGSAAGLAIGLALANLPIELHAVRVADERVASRQSMQRLIAKTVTLLHRLDNTIPLDTVTRTNIHWRDDFLAGGYASIDARTHNAIGRARSELNLVLEPVYTGKAFAALLHDVHNDAEGRPALFWNTYSSATLPASRRRSSAARHLPQEFLRYYD